MAGARAAASLHYGVRPDRDPAARRRATATLVAVVALWPLLHLAGFTPAGLVTLFDPANVATLGRFLAAFLPPEIGAEFLALLAKAAVETVAMASAGIALAFVLAVPLALGVTRVLAVAELGGRAGGQGAAPRQRQWAARARRASLRGVMMVLRGVPELVWALLFVRVFGLGPAAAVLALGLTYGGMLAKVYAEILESGDPRPARALLAAGSGRLAALAYGLLPVNARELTSYTVYRWECAVRASVVMGFVGAGGLGQLMDQAMKMLNGGEAASILAAFLALVLLADGVSALLRRRLEAAGERTDNARAGRPGAAPRAAGVGPVGALLALLLIGLVAGSFAYLDLGLAGLFTADAAAGVADFLAQFLRPEVSPEWLAKVGWGALETLAISASGSLLAALAGAVLALPAAGRFGATAKALTRFCLNVLRAVPELVWATLTALAAGLGPLAGALALAVHTAGVLGRLYGEALENAPAAPAQALRLAGAGPLAAFCYGTLPQVAPQWLAYGLYRWEINIRMAAVLGFVGAGGLGQALYFSLSLFHYAEAATLIAAMLALSVVVDAASGALRRRLG